MSPLLNLLALQNYLGLNQDCSRLDGVIHRQLHIGLIGPSCYWVVRSVRQVHFTAHNSQRTVKIASRRPRRARAQTVWATRPMPARSIHSAKTAVIDRTYSRQVFISEGPPKQAQAYRRTWAIPPYRQGRTPAAEVSSLREYPGLHPGLVSHPSRPSERCTAYHRQ